MNYDALLKEIDKCHDIEYLDGILKVSIFYFHIRLSTIIKSFIFFNTSQSLGLDTSEASLNKLVEAFEQYVDEDEAEDKKETEELAGAVDMLQNQIKIIQSKLFIIILFSCFTKYKYK